MKVLISSNRLDSRAGTQMFIRDLACELRRQGHTLIAYGTDLGGGLEFLTEESIPIARDLGSLPFRPDIIHGQHHLQTMSILTSLPDTPAIYHCHGAIWQECPPRHPRIHHYVAMTRFLAERMSVESCIPPGNISVLLNTVDLLRFHTVRNAPRRIRRALFFNSRHATDSPTLAAVKEATHRCGIELTLIGQTFGNRITAPEKELLRYDLVFASGRSAIEALSCGCAVIVLGRTSCGELIRPANLDRYRDANFSIPENSAPPYADSIAGEINLYSADECSATSASLRKEANLQTSVTRLISIYEKAIGRHQQTPQDIPEELGAISTYLRKITPLVTAADANLGRAWISASRASTFDELNARVVALEQRLARTVRGGDHS